MHLIFIRHGDPDYKNDTLTEKGRKEAVFLAERILKWKVDDFYVSPYGRAQATIAPALDLLGRSAETLDWLHEFDFRVSDPLTKKERCAWDWMPRDYYREEKYFNRKAWFRTKTMKSGGIEAHANNVCSCFDNLLAQYDYTRMENDTPIYSCFPHLTYDEAAVDTHLNPDQKDLDNKNLVFVCHLGVMFLIISHLTGISPVQLWQGFFVAPTSVTVLGAEERAPGEVVFRVQQLGDVRHLMEHAEPASASGFYGNVLNL
ncbi:MAG: histidine phosphatase family protein [Treponema sp.]|nr:histidine phosphatase family protein [Treponema sp.]